MTQVDDRRLGRYESGTHVREQAQGPGCTWMKGCSETFAAATFGSQASQPRRKRGRARAPTHEHPHSAGARINKYIVPFDRLEDEKNGARKAAVARVSYPTPVPPLGGARHGSDRGAASLSSGSPVAQAVGLRRVVEKLADPEYLSEWTTGDEEHSPSHPAAKGGPPAGYSGIQTNERSIEKSTKGMSLRAIATTNLVRGRVEESDEVGKDMSRTTHALPMTDCRADPVTIREAMPPGRRLAPSCLPPRSAPAMSAYPVLHIHHGYTQSLGEAESGRSVPIAYAFRRERRVALREQRQKSAYASGSCPPRPHPHAVAPHAHPAPASGSPAAQHIGMYTTTNWGDRDRLCLLAHLHGRRLAWRHFEWEKKLETGKKENASSEGPFVIRIRWSLLVHTHPHNRGHDRRESGAAHPTPALLLVTHVPLSLPSTIVPKSSGIHGISGTSSSPLHPEARRGSHIEPRQARKKKDPETENVCADPPRHHPRTAVDSSQPHITLTLPYTDAATRWQWQWYTDTPVASDRPRRERDPTTNPRTGTPAPPGVKRGGKRREGEEARGEKARGEGKEKEQKR
ncbi:hypothetical protein C8R43DRAFT_965240 [Mycena crocata]|nr:hypothetical protein C8R43DRAFT_965240 [Mycena crocata]